MVKIRLIVKRETQRLVCNRLISYLYGRLFFKHYGLHFL